MKMSAFFLTCRRLPPCCVLTGPLLLPGKIEISLASLPPLTWTSVLPVYSPTLMSHLALIASLKSPSQIKSHCGLENTLERRSNQSVLKEINPEFSLERLMLKLKLPSLGHLVQRADSLERTLMLRKLKGRGWDGWMTSSTQWMWVSANSGRWCRTGKPGVLQSMRSQKVGYELVTEQYTTTYEFWGNWRSVHNTPRNIF